MIPHRADDVVALVHAIARAIDVVALAVVADEGDALHRLGHGDPAQVQHRWAEVNRAHEPIIDLARSMRRVGPERFGKAHDQGNVRAGIIEPAFRPRQTDPVIGPEHHDRVLPFARLFQLADKFSGAGVHRGDELVVAFPVLAHHGRVGVVGRQIFKGGGILPLLCGEIFGDLFVFRLVLNPALVAAGEVEDGKERLPRFAIFPVRLSRGIVPDLTR